MNHEKKKCSPNVHQDHTLGQCDLVNEHTQVSTKLKTMQQKELKKYSVSEKPTYCSHHASHCAASSTVK